MCSFRLSETPCFFPKSLLDRLAENGKQLIRQLVESPEYRARSDASTPAEFRVANEPPQPLFVQVDFGLVRDRNGELQPKTGGVAGLPFPLCVSGDAGAKLHRSIWAGKTGLQFRGMHGSISS
jgi:hypothetical protein